MPPPHERASLPQRTTSNPFANAQKTSWGDTRSKEADRRRACIFEIPRETTLDQIKAFFGLECLEGVFMKHTKMGLMAFVQFKRESDFTSAILRSGQQFLDTGYKIKIRPWEEQEYGNRRKLTPTRPLESPPRRQYRERSRSRTSSPSWRDHSRKILHNRPSLRQRDIDDRSSERRHRNRDRSPSPGRSSSFARTPARSAHSFNWGASEVQENGWGTPDVYENGWGSTESRSFNRYDEPNVTMRQLETKTLPPNSHSFGLATMAPATSLPLSQTPSSLAIVAVSQSNSLAIASSDHTTFAQPQLQLQPLVEHEHTNYNNQMPQSIILLLGYVIQAKSAQSLSMTQLDEIIGFFEETKKKLKARDDNTQQSSSSATNSQEEPRSSALDPRLRNGHSQDESDTNAEELIKKLKGIH